MLDITRSLDNALTKQGWIFADRWSRIGHPYEWVDGDKTPAMYKEPGSLAVVQYLSMFYEEYPALDEIKTSDYDEMGEYLENEFRRILMNFAPFMDSQNSAVFQHYVKCMAQRRLQDYSFCKKFCKDLPSAVKHLDYGPGLGSHAVYSLKGFNSTYYGTDASPISYSVQRQVFRTLLKGSPGYLDTIDCENFCLPENAIRQELNHQDKYRVKHFPSWHLPLLSDGTCDLITATWMLNEITPAGILWLLSHATRVLKKGGYFYIRDSRNLKPSRHQINYDNWLIELGFECVKELKVVNRVDMHGVPRVYRNVKGEKVSFDELADRCLGKFLLPALGAGYAQDLTPVGGVLSNKK